MKTAFLWLKEWKQSRYANIKSFWDTKNFGAAVLRDCLRKADIDVDVCTVDNAKDFDIVMVSLTSLYDVLAFLRTVYQNKDWENRKFKVLAGGFGMQNPRPLMGYVDYCFFGRAENEIVDIIKNNCDYNHPSYLKLADGIKPIVINQVEQVYQDEVEIDFNGKRKYRESMLGCRHKCTYCHYSYARKHVSDGQFIYNELEGASDEIEWCDATLYNPIKPHIITAMDGWSERLRIITGKQLKNEKLLQFFQHIAGKTYCDAVCVKLYNITNFETETEDDYFEFVDNIMNLDGELKKPVYITVQTTPLNPAVLTPSEYAPIILNDLNEMYLKNGSKIYEGENIRVTHSMFLDSPYMHFLGGLAARYMPKHEALMNYVVSGKGASGKTKSEQLKTLQNKFDISDIIREYSIDEELPCGFLSGYVDKRIVRKMREVMRKRLYNSTPNSVNKEFAKETIEMLNTVAKAPSISKKKKKLKRMAYYQELL